MKGFIKLEAVNAETGERRLLAEWFANQILLSGMAQMDQRTDWMTWCQVGTSDAAVSEVQTSLQGWVAGTNTLAPAGSTVGAQSTQPYYGWRQTVFRFDPLTGTNQNLNEVGVGWGDGDAGNENTLISRALIVDINDVRITPTWIVGEYLDMTYELRYYPPLGDVTGTVDLNGVTYNYILRAAAVTSTFDWGTPVGDQMGARPAAGNWVAWDSDIGAITDAGPTSGLSANCDNSNQYDLAVAPAYTIGMVCDCGSAGWNLVGGMRSLVFKTTAGSYQIQFGEGAGATGNKIPKDNTFTMQFQFEMSWNWQ